MPTTACDDERAELLAVDDLIDDIIGDSIKAMLLPHIHELSSLDPDASVYLTSCKSVPSYWWVSSFLRAVKNAQPDTFRAAVSADLSEKMERIVSTQAALHTAIAEARAALSTKTTPHKEPTP